MKAIHMLALLGAATIAVLPLSGALAQPAAAPAAPAMQPTIVGPALYVSDMERSLRFYRDALGMTVRIQFGPKDKPDVMIGFGADPSKPCCCSATGRPVRARSSIPTVSTVS